MAMESGQRTAYLLHKPEEAKLNMLYAGWSSSTGELDWVLRPLLATSSFPPAMSNYAYFSNPEVDARLKAALQTTDRAEKQKIYDEAQKLIWNEAPWVFLSVDHDISASSKKLVNFHSLPDGGFDFVNAELVK